MGRTLLWIGVAAVLGAAGWWVFLHDGPGDPQPYEEADLFDDDAEELAGGPGLKGTGGTHAAPTPASGPGRYVIRGRVVTEAGVGVADVPVTARRTSRPQDPASRVGWLPTLAESVREVRAGAEASWHDRHPVVQRARTDADGRFTLRVDDHARYRIEGTPPVPDACTYATVWLNASREEAVAELTLLPGSPLHGTVVDAAGTPLVASVEATWSDRAGTTWRTWSGERVPTAAVDGTWRIAAAPHGTIRFTVQLPDGRSVSGLQAEAPHEGPIVLRIPSGSARVEGTVTDPGGAPVADAAVSLYVAPPEGATEKVSHHLRIRTDADGRFAFTAVPAGRITTIQAAAEGFLPKRDRVTGEASPEHMITAGATTTLSIVLERGGVVTGRVRALDADTPIAGAVVQLVPQGRNNVQFRTEPATTDADGAYRIEQVPAGTYVALAEATDCYLPHLATGTDTMVAPGAQQAPADLLVVVQGQGEPVTRDLRLGRGFAVHGVVVDAGGKGVAGAEVHARGYGLAQLGWRWGIRSQMDGALATSGADGAFTVRGLPPRTDWVLYARKEGLVAKFTQPFALVAGAKAPEVTLELATGATIRGRVEGLAAGERPKAQVGYWGTGQERSAKAHGHPVAEDGTFEITGVPPGSWTVHLFAGGRQASQVAVNGIEAGEVREDVVITIAESVEVAGVVVDSDGRPVAGLSLTLGSLGTGGGWAHGSTDQDGRFKIVGAAAGRAQFSTHIAGRQVQIGSPFTAPATDLRLVYDKPKVVVLRGEVVAEDGTEIAVCTVAVEVPGERSPRMMGQDPRQTNALGGTFELRVSGTGPYAVTASKPRGADGQALNLRTARVMVKDASQPIRLSMPPGLSIAGRVLGPAGKGLPGITLRVGRETMRTDPTGRFELPGLAEGEVQVYVGQAGAYIVPAPQRVKAGTQDIVFRLVKGESIQGRALDGEGKPLASGYASARWDRPGGEGQAGASGQIQEGGRFELQGIPPDVRVTVQVQAWAASGGVAYAPAIIEDVRPGTKDLEVRLGGGLVIEGRVLDADGTSGVACFIYGQSKDGKRQTGWVQVGTDGKFRLGGLEPIPYVVRIQRQDGGVTPAPREVLPPKSGIEIRLPRAVALRGRVTGVPEGEGAGWLVHVRSASGDSLMSSAVQADGTFEFAAVPDATDLHLTVRKRGASRYAMAGPIRGARTDLVLELKEGVTIRGRIEGCLVNGKPTGNVWVQGGLLGNAFGQIAEDGTFVVHGLAPGAYEVHARGGAENKHTRVENITAGSADVVLDLR